VIDAQAVKFCLLQDLGLFYKNSLIYLILIKAKFNEKRNLQCKVLSAAVSILAFKKLLLHIWFLALKLIETMRF